MCISGHMNQQLQNSKVGQIHQYISTQVYVSVYKMSAYKCIYCFSLETSLVYVKHMLTTQENVLITYVQLYMVTEVVLSCHDNVHGALCDEQQHPTMYMQPCLKSSSQTFLISQPSGLQKCEES